MRFAVSATVCAWLAALGALIAVTVELPQAIDYVFIGVPICFLLTALVLRESASLSQPILAEDPAPEEEEAMKAQRHRLFFLDNLKVALTALVVLHHSVCAFSGQSWYYAIGSYQNSFHTFALWLLGLNQCYFMALFFFISGFMTPTSLQRKGARRFWLDRLKRLLLPLLLFSLGLEPALILFIIQVGVGATDLSPYVPGVGPCWYVLWLLIFSCAYLTIAVQPGAPVRLANPTCGALGGSLRPLRAAGAPCAQVRLGRPRLFLTMLLSLPLSALNLGVMALTPSLLGMPITWGSLPFDIAFFTAGLLGRLGGWLDAPLPRREAIGAWIAVAIGAVVTAVMVVLFPLGPPTGPHEGNLTLPSSLMLPNSSGNATSPPAAVYGGISLGFGVLSISISFALLDLFLRRANGRAVSLAPSAYTVYIIHPLVLVPLTWAYVELLRSAWGIEVRFEEGTARSSTDLGDDRLLWFGCAAVSVLAQLLVWPLAAVVRRAPGLRAIL